MSLADPTRSRLPHATRLHRAGRALLVAVVIGALGLVGYDAWLWVFAGDALERLTGVHVDAQLQFQVRLTPVSSAVRATHLHSLHFGSDA